MTTGLEPGKNIRPQISSKRSHKRSQGDIKTSHSWRKHQTWTPEQEQTLSSKCVIPTAQQSSRLTSKDYNKLFANPIRHWHKNYFSLNLTKGQGAGHSSKTSRPSLKNSLTTKRTTWGGQVASNRSINASSFLSL